MARSPKTLKATIVDAPIIDQPQAATIEEETPESFFAKVQGDWAYLIKGEASWKRWAIAVVASLATSAAVGYLGGYLAVYLTFAAALMTGSMFITYVVYALGVLLTMYAGYRASMFTYIKVIDRSVDDLCAKAYDRVTGLFTFGTKVAA